MKKIYIIIESPGKVETIKQYISNNYEIIASYGHITELAKGGRYGIGVNPIDNFKAYYMLMKDKMPFLDKIISNADNIDKIILATDDDIEGHSISWHISKYIRHLNIPIYRCIFNEITKNGIENGLNNLSELDINKYHAANVRRILDRIVGFMVSPFLINYYGDNLSAGRVQSVAARMIIEREQEINCFNPEEYWVIIASLVKEQQIFTAKFQGKIKNKMAAEKIKLELEQPTIYNSVFKISSLKKKPKKEYPDPPLNTAKLQQIMATKFGMEGERTMAAAQRLYEAGLVSYIRTDSIRAADTAIKTLRAWLNTNNLEVPVRSYLYKNKDAAQDAHECIRPTDINKTPKTMNLYGDELDLYRTVWNYFVASQMVPAVYDTLDAKVLHELSGHQFKITGKLLVEPGYLYVLEGKSKSNNILPNLNNEDLLKLVDDKSICFEQKFTQASPRFTYASLVKELESNGVGRPSTFAAISSTILNRGYVIKKGNTYHGTLLGEKINGILKQYFDFLAYDYTALLEKQMDDIALGKLNHLEVLNDFYSNFKNKLKKAHLDNDGKICDKCGAPMYLRIGKYSKFWNCALFPFCSSVKQLEKNTQMLVTTDI